MTENLGLENFKNSNTEGGGANNSDFLDNCLPPEISYSIYNLQKLQNSEKSTAETCRMY